MDRLEALIASEPSVGVPEDEHVPQAEAVDRIVAPVRTLLEAWWQAAMLNTSAGNYTARQHSLAIQHAIATLMEHGQWNAPVQAEVRAMLGGQRAAFDISAAQRFVEIRTRT